MTAIHQQRISAVRRRLGDCDGALITSIPNIRYLTGFTGSTALFAFTPHSEHLIVDFRYVEQATCECSCAITKREGMIEDSIAGWLEGVTRCAVEADQMSVSLWNRLNGNRLNGNRLSGKGLDGGGKRTSKKAARPDGESAAGAKDRRAWDGAGTAAGKKKKEARIEFVPGQDLVEGVRIIKDPDEIRRLEAAAELLESLMRRTIESVHAGAREIDIAAFFADAARRETGLPLPFEPIVASGVRGALPHGTASSKEIRNGELVTLDLGVALDGYVADMTRTIAVGAVEDRAIEIHNAVNLANRTAVQGIRPGMRGDEAHTLAAGVLQASDLAKHFGHGLGHGIGIEVHETPRLSPVSNDLLRPGMTFTIEPGVYIPGWGGVRIEDAGVLTETGMRIFNKMERSLVRI